MLKKGITLLICLFVVYATLVATHRGEFWPFSIYPMFSQGGQPWTHVLVRELPIHPGNVSWINQPRNTLPGKVFHLKNLENNPGDLFLKSVSPEQWNKVRIRQIRSYFKPKLDQHSFLLLKVHGRIIHENDASVKVTYTPLILIQKDTTLFNPRIFGSLAYQSGL